MHETTPKVHVIAHTVMNWDVVENYLTEIGGVEWSDRMHDDGLWGEHGSALAEFAGRLCYRSWAPGLNANVTKVREDSKAYHDNTLASGHGAIYEHASYTFLFQDVSRVFTHELVRHRAGVAISQESLRYVRLTDIGFRIPPALEDARGAVIDIVEHLEEMQADLAELFGLDDEGTPFHVKKEVTSAMRRIAPLGLSTNILWTANLRTLRHVLALRTAPAAEEEMRLVFGEVARVMAQREPLAFTDMDIHPNGSVTFEHGKV